MHLYQQEDHYIFNVSTQECSSVNGHKIEVLLHSGDLENLRDRITELLETGARAHGKASE